MRSTFATTIRRDRLGDFCLTELAAFFLFLFLSSLVLLSALDAPAPPFFVKDRAVAHPTTGTRRPYIVLLARLTLRRCACASRTWRVGNSRQQGRVAACSPASHNTCDRPLPSLPSTSSGTSTSAGIGNVGGGDGGGGDDDDG